jgi:hypothetical protein
VAQITLVGQQTAWPRLGGTQSLLMTGSGIGRLVVIGTSNNLAPNATSSAADKTGMVELAWWDARRYKAVLGYDERHEGHCM